MIFIIFLTFIEYSYIGCYRNSNDHDLLQGSHYTNRNMMSVRVCVTSCRKGNFQYAGTEVGGFEFLF